MAKNEAKIKFTAETGEFNEQISKAESSLKELRSELKLNSAQMKKTGDNTKTLQQRQKILATELEASRSKTEALSQKLEKAKEIFGENSEQAKKYQTQLNNAKAAEEKIQDEIEDTNKKLKEQKTAFDEVSEKAEKAGDKLTNAGKKMLGVTGGIAAVGTASIAAFNAVDEGADNAIKATGATGEAAEGLETAYKNVASSIVGDFGSIGSALGEVNTRFGFTGQQLEAATTDFVKFAEVTGMDVTTAVQKVSRYMGDAGIDSSEYASVLDSLTVAAQGSGISMDTLSENLTKYGAPMRALGFDTKESIAIFSSWEKAGVNTEIAFSGMKKAISTWSADGKDARVEFKKTLDEIKACPDIASATTKAIEVFGAKAGPDLADAIQGGRFEYSEMLSLIEGSEGALSGTFDETVDGGYEMELAMQNAKVALAEVGDTLATSLVPIVKSATDGLKKFADWWSGLSEKTQNTIIKVAAAVAAIGPLLLIFGKVAGAVSKISSAMKLLSPVITIVKTAMSGLNLSFLACPITWIIAAIVALIAIFVVLWKKCDWFRNFWKKMWDGIKNAFHVVVEWVKKNWKALLLFIVNPVAGVFKYLYDNCEGFRKVVDKVVKAVKKFFVDLWNGIKNTFKNVGSWFKEKFTAAKNGVVNAWSSVKGFFSKCWSGIKNAFSNVKNWFRDKFNSAKTAVTNVWNGITGFFKGVYTKVKNTFANVKNAIFAPFKTAIDKVKGLFNKLKLKFPNIKLPHFSVSPKGWKIGDLLKGSIPKLGIEWYAEGGILKKPTIFGMNGGQLLGGGEAGYEAVLPIDRLQGYISAAVNRNVRGLDISELAGAVEELAERPVVVKLNGREIARATASDSDSVNGLRSSFRDRGLEID